MDSGEKNALVSGRSFRAYEVSDMGKSLVIPLIFRGITFIFFFNFIFKPGIGIKEDAADIAIPAPIFSVRSVSVPDWVSLFRYRNGTGIGIYFHSGSGLTGCRTVRRCSILKDCTRGGNLVTVQLRS
jgi:hypothetical protein